MKKFSKLSVATILSITYSVFLIVITIILYLCGMYIDPIVWFLLAINAIFAVINFQYLIGKL